MRAQLLTAITITLLAGACDSPEPAQPRKSIQVRSEQQEGLHKLSEQYRHVALRRALHHHAPGFVRRTGADRSAPLAHRDGPAGSVGL